MFQSLKGQESKTLIHYDVYIFSIRERIMFIIQGMLILALFSYVFYRSIFVFLLLSPSLYFYMKLKNKECIKKRKLMLSMQFRELMNVIIAGLQAGYSIENAFIRGYQDMILLFGKNSLISNEMKIIIENLRNNQNIEDLLRDFGERSYIQDIKDFSESFAIAKRSGGDMVSNLKRTADVIADKMDVRRKIETIISSKKLEQSIMNVVPFGIILYIDMTSPGFFDSLYHNVTGVAIMTAMMIVYFVAYYIAQKIIDIEV